MLRTGKYHTKQMKDMRKKVDIPPSCNVQFIWDDSKFGPEGRLLVILIHASKGGSRLLHIHPESLIVGITFGTNFNKNNFSLLHR